MAKQPVKPPARKPGPAPRPRTPVADELLAAIRAWTDSGRTVYDLARESGVASSQIARFASGERSVKLATLEALAVPLQLRLIQVGGRVGRGRA